MKWKRKKSFWQQDIRKREYLQAILVGSFIIGTVSYLFYGKWYYAILFSPYLIRHVKSWEIQYIKKKKANFHQQFKEAIQSLSAALNVGYSVENALRETVKDLRTIYKKEVLLIKELTYVIRQIEMNLPVETALTELANRTEDEDVQTFVTVFNMAKRSGGDMLEMIRNTVRQMGEKIDVEREIETILAAKKMEFHIMTLIPFGMIAYLKVSFPEFIQVLYGNLFGVVVMTVCLAIYVVSYEMGKRIVEIEV